jgi:hypothetical protein
MSGQNGSKVAGIGKRPLCPVQTKVTRVSIRSKRGITIHTTYRNVGGFEKTNYKKNLNLFVAVFNAFYALDPAQNFISCKPYTAWYLK